VDIFPDKDLTMKNILIAVVVIVVALVMFSCATSPKKEPKAVEEQKIVEEKEVSEKEYEAMAENLQQETDTLIAKADDIKANVAMKKEYDRALAIYEKAMNEKSKGNHKKAAELFEKAKKLFEELYQQTEVKRARAEKSIEESKRELQLVEEKAKEAEL
jgi:hypothetical protein